MKKVIYEIESNEKLVDNVYKIILKGDSSDFKNPGQFLDIKIKGFYLRRPISIYDISENSVSIIYKVVGKGTEKLSEMKKGETLDCLSGLGNGFNTNKSGETPVLLGGGVGIPPMYYLCKTLLNENKRPSVVLGFNSASEVFCLDAFKNLCVNTYLMTVDGSAGEKGFAADALKKINYSYLYCCGPEQMLKSCYDNSSTDGQFSFEERMGCGFGACMGCSCKTKYGYKRICRDGPVLEKGEIIW